MNRIVNTHKKMLTLVGCLMVLSFFVNPGGSIVQAAEEIRIGFLAPLTGGLAKPGNDSMNGFKLFWEQAGYEAGGRPVRIIYADTVCNPSNALTEFRRLAYTEKVHLVIGGLCGHEGPAVAQASLESGVPAFLHAGADGLTKWDRTPTVVRTTSAASQIAHPFGAYLYEELGARNVAFIGQDYAWGHGLTLGAIQTFKEAGGTVAKLLWTPIGTLDYSSLLAEVPSDVDLLVVNVVGADRTRLFEQYFNLGFDQKYKIAGGYWLHSDVLPDVDGRAVGLISQCNGYSTGLDTPENKAFIEAFIQTYKTVPSWMAEMAYTSALFAKTAIDAINGNIEESETFLQTVRNVEVQAPRGPVRLDEYDNPIHNVYISKIEKVNDPLLGEIMINVPIKTYDGVSQFWNWSPEEFLSRGPYKR